MSEKKENSLLVERFDIDHKILEYLQTLVDANWDSVTAKHRLQTLLIRRDSIMEELSKLGQERKNKLEPD